LIGTATDPHMNEPEFRLDFTLKAGLPPSKKLQNTTEESSLEAVTK
jgi:hypothetical protein